MNFIETVESLDFGNVLSRLENMQKEAIKRARAVNKTATITLTVKYKADGLRGIKVDGKPKLDLPESDFGATSLFVSENNEVSLDDPDQMTFDNVKSIEGGPKKMKEV